MTFEQSDSWSHENTGESEHTELARRFGYNYNGAAEPIEGAATAFELSSEHFGQMHHLTDLAFTENGLEASSEDPMPCGVAVTIGFQSEACCARRGRVTACEPYESFYHVAVAIDLLA
jgi:hypothetical protein